MLGARARQVHGERLSYQNLKKAQSYMKVLVDVINCATGKTASVEENLFTIHLVIQIIHMIRRG